MTAVAPISPDAQDLPSLIDRAASTLAGAKTAAEVLEARDMAGLAYDVAKRAARLHRAKSAHDDLVAAAHRAQAHALEIEACAKRRLADEYDAAQARGEVFGAHDGARKRVEGPNAIASTADLGLRRDQIHEARQIRDAEAALLDDARRFMRRKGIECLAEADRLDALYAAVTSNDPAASRARQEVSA